MAIQSMFKNYINKIDSWEQKIITM